MSFNVSKVSDEFFYINKNLIMIIKEEFLQKQFREEY